MRAGMKEAELRKFARCARCERLVGETGMPIMWTLTIDRHGLDAGALRRQQGLGMMLGGALAMHMGPDEDMTMPLLEQPVKVMICEPCSGALQLPELIERGGIDA